MTVRELYKEEIKIISEEGVFAVRVAGSGYTVDDLVIVNDYFVAVKGYEEDDIFNWHFDELIGQ